MSENTANIVVEVSKSKLRFTKLQILQAAGIALVVAASAWVITDTVKSAKALDAEDDVENND